MRLTKWYIGHRVLWLLMALHILNFSIDNPHTLFDGATVDEDFEEVDSVIELVLEDVMQIDNAIPEHHTKSNPHNRVNAKKMVWTFQSAQPYKITAPTVVNYKVVHPETFYKDPLYHSPRLALFSPPPEV